MAYVYKNRFSDEQERKFMDAKTFVDFLPEGELIPFYCTCMSPLYLLVHIPFQGMTLRE